MAYNHLGSYVRDAVVATAVVVGLYGLAFGVQFQPFQIPGYLLIVGFDMVEGVFGSAGAYYDVLFYGYLIGLGLIGAGVVHMLRARTHKSVPGWRIGVAGALVVVGVLSLLFALLVLFGSSRLDPVLITGATGLILLAVAGWLAGVFGRQDAVASE